MCKGGHLLGGGLKPSANRRGSKVFIPGVYLEVGGVLLLDPEALVHSIAGKVTL